MSFVDRKWQYGKLQYHNYCQQYHDGKHYSVKTHEVPPPRNLINALYFKRRVITYRIAGKAQQSPDTPAEKPKNEKEEQEGTHDKKCTKRKAL